MNKELFKQIAKEKEPKKNVFKDLSLAFIGGGIIGVFSQGVIDLGTNFLSFSKENAFVFASLVLVLISALLTSFSLYNPLGQTFGAGIFIPVTGFANSMISCGIEGKSEGPIYGIGSRAFSLAGSVIIYGVLSSVIVVFIRYLLTFIGVGL